MINSSEFSNEFNTEKWLTYINRLKPDNFELDMLVMCFTGLIVVASVLGNSLTCFIIWRNKSMHTTTNYYLFNLAVSDLILTFAMLLPIIDQYLTANSLIICQLYWSLIAFLWNNGILRITALAIERCVAVCYPFLLETAPTTVCRRVAKVILLVWMVAITETVLEMRNVGLIETDKASPVCFTIATPTARLVIGVLAVVTFAIPLVIMATAYSMIAYRVNKAWVNNPGDQIFNQMDTRSKTNKLVIAITVSFLICWMPFFITKMLICTLDVDQLLQLPVAWSYWYYVVILSGWLSLVLNPILYNLMSKKFRHALKMHWNAVIRIIFRH